MSWKNNAKQWRELYRGIRNGDGSEAVEAETEFRRLAEQEAVPQLVAHAFVTMSGQTDTVVYNLADPNQVRNLIDELRLPETDEYGIGLTAKIQVRIMPNNYTDSLEEHWGY